MFVNKFVPIFLLMAMITAVVRADCDEALCDQYCLAQGEEYQFMDCNFGNCRCDRVDGTGEILVLKPPNYVPEE